MNYGEFMAFHRKNPAGRLYLLAGEEGYYIEKAKKRLLEMLFPDGVNIEDIMELPAETTVNELLMNANSVPCFTEKKVIIIKNMNFLVKKKADSEETEKASTKGKKKKDTPEDMFLRFIENVPDFTTVIFINNHSADKRKKIFKAIAKHGIILEAEPIKSYKTEEVGEWLRGKLQELHKDMDNDAFQYFLGAVSMMQTISLGYLEQELNKLALFMGKEEKRIDRKLLVTALSSMPEVSGFAMLSAISEHNVKKALYLFKRQVEEGVFTPLIVGMLVRHVRQLWQAKDLMSRGIRGKALGPAMGGMNTFIAERIGRESMSFTAEQLKTAFLDLADVDYALKMGQGTAVELESIIISLCERQTTK